MFLVVENYLILIKEEFTMAKEKKNVEALDDEKLEKASGGMANPYWTKKPPVDLRPSIYHTGRMRKPDLSQIDLSRFKNAQEGK